MVDPPGRNAQVAALGQLQAIANAQGMDPQFRAAVAQSQAATATQERAAPGPLLGTLAPLARARARGPRAARRRGAGPPRAPAGLPAAGGRTGPADPPPMPRSLVSDDARLRARREG